MKEELSQMVRDEAEKLGVGSKEFLQRHNDLMEQIERLLEENRQRRAARQMFGAKDIMEILGVSESKTYSYIRQMNIELEKKDISRSGAKYRRHTSGRGFIAAQNGEHYERFRTCVFT